MEDQTNEKKAHRKRLAGPKAAKKKAKSPHIQDLTPQQRNPKAFSIQHANKTLRTVQRTQDLKTKKQHIPLVDRTPLEPPPVVVGVVGPPKVGKTTLLRCVVKNFTKQRLTRIQGPVTVVSGKQRRLTLIECNNDISAMIDIAKVADLVLLLVDASFGFEMETFEFLNICQVHGFPRIMGVLTHLDSFKDNKKLRKTKKRLKHRFWTEVYQGAKLFYLSGMVNGEYQKTEVHNLCRFISVMKFRPLTWRTTHPYILADRMEDITDPEQIRQFNKCDRNVSLYGYLHGTHMKNNISVHIPGCGDFSIHDIQFLNDPCPTPEKQKKRSLSQRDRLIYAPMSGVGGIVYDRDAVYIDLGGSHSHTNIQKDEDVQQPVNELVSSLMALNNPVDMKMTTSQVALYSEGIQSSEGAKENQDEDYIGGQQFEAVQSDGRVRRRAVFEDDSQNQVDDDDADSGQESDEGYDEDEMETKTLGMSWDDDNDDETSFRPKPGKSAKQLQKSHETEENSDDEISFKPTNKLQNVLKKRAKSDSGSDSESEDYSGSSDSENNSNDDASDDDDEESDMEENVERKHKKLKSDKSEHVSGSDDDDDVGSEGDDKDDDDDSKDDSDTDDEEEDEDEENDNLEETLKVKTNSRGSMSGSYSKNENVVARVKPAGHISSLNSIKKLNSKQPTKSKGAKSFKTDKVSSESDSGSENDSEREKTSKLKSKDLKQKTSETKDKKDLGSEGESESDSESESSSENENFKTSKSKKDKLETKTGDASAILGASGATSQSKKEKEKKNESNIPAVDKDDSKSIRSLSDKLVKLAQTDYYSRKPEETVINKTVSESKNVLSSTNEEEDDVNEGSIEDEDDDSMEDDGGEDYGSEVEGEGEGESFRWKHDLAAQAAANFRERQASRTNYRKLIYGKDEESNEDKKEEDTEEDDEIGGLFKVLKEKSATGMADRVAINSTDCSKPQKYTITQLDVDRIQELIADCFVTGKWDESKDAEALLQQDDEVYGDFEDLETGEKHSAEAKGSQSNEDDSDKGVITADQHDDMETHPEGDKKTKKSELTGEEKRAEKKRKLKEMFDMQYDMKGDSEFYDNWKEELEQQAKLNRSVFEDMEDEVRVQYEGFRPGMYVRVEIRGVPCEFVTNFDATYPVILGGLLSVENNVGYVQTRLKKHRWHKKILKTKNPLIFSLGWRRFQSIPLYSIQDHNMRNRLLKYTPEHLHCHACFWGPITPQGTGLLAVENIANVTPDFRIAATGVVLELDKSFQIVKKLKLIGSPQKIYNKTAFIQGMFNSALEVAKFEGASLRTVSGIRGQIKKAAKTPEGAFRATFEDKILLSDMVFLRTWYPVEVPQFYNPVTTMLLPPEQKQNWSGLKTYGDLHREKNMKTTFSEDSLYKKIERKGKTYTPLSIPKALQRVLPFKDTPKSLLEKKDTVKRIAVIKEPHEAKISKMVSMLKNVYEHKRRTEHAQMRQRAAQHQKQIQKIDREKQKKHREVKKQVFRMLGKMEQRKNAHKNKD